MNGPLHTAYPTDTKLEPTAQPKPASTNERNIIVWKDLKLVSRAQHR